MNIFGIGTAELIAILIIMLIVAGPKRMIQWAYTLGVYMSKMKAMWSETVKYLQQELDEAGVDIQLPKEVPTRANIRKMADSVIQPVQQPIQDSLKQVQDEVNQATSLEKSASNLAEPSEKAPVSQNGDLGAWSRTNKDDSDLGSWSKTDN